MNVIANSWTLTKHSFAVLKERKILLVFPFIGLLASLIFFFAAVLPILAGVTIFDLANAVAYPDQATAAMGRWSEDFELFLADATPGEVTLLLVGFLIRLYLLCFLGIFGATFLHVAAVSEVFHALNGENVSIARGLKLAGARLKPIVVWTLFSGCVGIAIRFVFQWLPFGTTWIATLLGGVAWSVATFFVVPVLIREPQTTNPLQLVRTSAGLLRRTWGESLITVAGGPLLIVMPGLLLSFFIFEFVLASIVKLLALGSAWVVFDALASALFVLLLLFIPIGACLIGALSGVIYKIFYSGLYVYAAEGVPPGTFTAEEFDMAWVVRGKKG
jgi:hypothetical protein